MGIQQGSTTPLYQQIADDIRRKIASGEIPPGMRIQPFRMLAREYGVSVMTINKAISGLVSEGVLYSRVGKGTFAAEKQVPKQGLNGNLIGFVLRDLTSPYFSEIVRSAEEAAAKEGYHILFSHSANSLDKEDDQIYRFLDLGVKGLIIASMSRTYTASAAIRQIHKDGFPYVTVSYMRDEDIYMVAMDSERAGYLATEHLLQCGYRKIGYIDDGRDSIAGDLRKRGHLNALQKHGLTSSGSFEYHYPFVGEWNDYRSGYEIGRIIANQQDQPDAMFVFNDLGALGLENALLDHGIRVPDDIAIVGVDDIEQSVQARVPLTTIHQPRTEIGKRAVDVVLRRLRGESVQVRTLLEPRLIVRHSSKRADQEISMGITSEQY